MIEINRGFITQDYQNVAPKNQQLLVIYISDSSPSDEPYNIAQRYVLDYSSELGQKLAAMNGRIVNVNDEEGDAETLEQLLGNNTPVQASVGTVTVLQRPITYVTCVGWL